MSSFYLHFCHSSYGFDPVLRHSSYVQTNATTHSIVGPTMLGVVASVGTKVKVWTVSHFCTSLNNTQQHATGCANGYNPQHVTSNNVASVLTGLQWKPPYALYTHVDPFGAKFSTLPLWFASENLFFNSLTNSGRPAVFSHASMSFPIVLCSFSENASRNFSPGFSDCSQFWLSSRNPT